MIIHQLSKKTRNIFRSYREDINFDDGVMLASVLSRILSDMEFLWCSDVSTTHFVSKCGSDLVVKATKNVSDFTEYTSLQYLEFHKPNLPIPRTQGLITCGQSAYLFLSYIPGSTLTEVWSQLEYSQKQALSAELDTILSDLRQLERPRNMPLGGVGDGLQRCKKKCKEMPSSSSLQ